MNSLSSTALRRSSIVLPYWACCALVICLLPISTPTSWPEAGLAIALQVAVGAAMTYGRFVRLPRAATFAGVAAYLLSVALLRDGGGASGGYGALVLLPVMWAALHNRRGELWFGVLGVACVYFVPVLAVGGDAYPVSGWRSGALITVIAASVGSGVAHLVKTLQAQIDHSASILATMSEGFALVKDGEIVAVNRALAAMTWFEEGDLLGARMPFPFLPGSGQDIPDDGEAMLQRADGSSFPAHIRSTPGRLSDGSKVKLTTLRDISAEKAHEEAISRRADDLAAIASVTRALSHSSPEDARQVICDVAVAITRARGAIVWELDQDGRVRSLTCAGAEKSWLVEPGTAAPRSVRAAWDCAEPLMLSASDRLVESERGVPAGAESVFFQPIKAASGMRGMLALYWSEGRDRLPAESEALLTVLADEAAVALERADLLRRLEELSHTDDLTGLPNRRAWTEALQREMKLAERSGRPLALALLDLDHFKRYNDLHGHLAGDELLKSFAGLCREGMRETDVVARWGGEEFAVLLPGCDARTAGDTVERLRGTARDGVTFSAGVAEWDGAKDIDALTGAADDALYAAKRGGRDRVEVRSLSSSR